jgi:aminoglycoside phosphotransferase (APT) family kinase protein
VSDTASPELTAKLRGFLVKHSLLDPNDSLACTPLLGGVSSDIWRVQLPNRTLCVKQALPALRVSAHWEAPVSRNATEWAWLCFAFAHRPLAVPKPLAHDPQAGLFAMAYLPPDEFPVWKQMLFDGKTSPRTAGEVGDVIATLHNASAGDPDVARRFDTLDTFTAIRLEPYLLATADRHPSLASQLRALVDRTAHMKTALVHGDVSPKNILVGPHGPVILDAECAWYGDPAFDLAFCLTHFLLKSALYPHRTVAYLRNFEALATSYLSRINFEPRAALDWRAASLLPALLLARIDGKSPVEYLLGKSDVQHWVRNFASPLIAKGPTSVNDVAEQWRRQSVSLPSKGASRE